MQDGNLITIYEIIHGDERFGITGNNRLFHLLGGGPLRYRLFAIVNGMLVEDFNFVSYPAEGEYDQEFMHNGILINKQEYDRLLSLNALPDVSVSRSWPNLFAIPDQTAYILLLTTDSILILDNNDWLTSMPLPYDGWTRFNVAPRPLPGIQTDLFRSVRAGAG